MRSHNVYFLIWNSVHQNFFCWFVFFFFAEENARIMHEWTWHANDGNRIYAVGRTKACQMKVYDNVVIYANAMHEYDKGWMQEWYVH